MRVVTIVQARMGSTRLPGKIMLDLAGKPLLARVIDRIKRSEKYGKLVIATSTLARDDVVADFCNEIQKSCFRGSESDLLDRYYYAAKAFGADVVVRITSDCPLIDPLLIDDVIGAFMEKGAGVDYLSNFYPEYTYPHGLETEVMGMAALEKAWKEDQNPAWREHVSDYILNNPEKFNLSGIGYSEVLTHHRWTVDYLQDFELVSKIYDHFQENVFNWIDILALLEQNPEWIEINSNMGQ